MVSCKEEQQVQEGEDTPHLKDIEIVPPDGEELPVRDCGTVEGWEPIVTRAVISYVFVALFSFFIISVVSTGNLTLIPLSPIIWQALGRVTAFYLPTPAQDK